MGMADKTVVNPLVPTLRMRILVHKRMFYIRTNPRMLQHSNVKCNIQMLILCSKMMYFGDFVVLVPYISSGFIFIT